MDFSGIFSALFNIIGSPYNMFLLLLAVPIGMFFGAVPGLGGKLGVVMVIPFVFGMDPISGAIFLISMHAVVHTAGSVPSILFGVPGTGAEAATIVDGLPMNKRGEAGRAMGAALGASGLGGVIGALFLLAVLPVLRPVILAFSPAEFFLLAIFGITFIAMLSGNSLIKGLLVGFFGLMMAFINLDPNTGIERYTFGMYFLWDGVDIITAILAIFAIPEMIALGVEGGAMAMKDKHAKAGYKGVMQGLMDVVRNWGLAVRTSIIGAFIGMIPGLGGDAATWICYGHALQSSKDPESFGKGNVRGVIAPETANNSKEGGSLLPTLFFAVPGSSGMAILLGAFVMLGIQPGPSMAISGMDIVWTLIWTLMIANVVAVGMFLLFVPLFGYLSYVRGSLLIPFVFTLTFLGSFLGHRAWENLIILTVLGIFGYFLKKYGWPRAPFVIGLILGPIAEDSYHKAMMLWGPEFLLRPGALTMITLIVVSISIYSWKMYKNSKKTDEANHSVS